MLLWMPRGNGPTCVLLHAVLKLLDANQGDDGMLESEKTTEKDGTTCSFLFRKGCSLVKKDKNEQEGMVDKKKQDKSEKESETEKKNLVVSILKTPLFKRLLQVW